MTTGLLDSRQPSFTEVPMRLIGLAVVLAVNISIAQLAAEAQPAPARLAMLLTGPLADVTPEYAAFMKQLGDLG
jgi:hypothetical protein